MEKFADLHLHTNYSDSTQSPKEVVAKAIQEQVACISITDHDTLAGIKPALAAAQGQDLEIIAGIELSSELNGKDIHILGYFLDPDNKVFTDSLNNMQNTRIERMQKMILKLSNLGIDDIILDEVCALANSRSVGRPHLAQILVEKKHVKDIKQAFDRYLAEGASCYVPKFKQTPYDAINLINKCGGIAVLAHPVVTNVDELIPSFVDAGLLGLECYYPFTSPQITEYYVGLTQKHNIGVTGGSDDHGANRSSASLGSVKLPYLYVEQLKRLWQNNKVNA